MPPDLPWATGTMSRQGQSGERDSHRAMPGGDIPLPSPPAVQWWPLASLKRLHALQVPVRKSLSLSGQIVPPPPSWVDHGSTDQFKGVLRVRLCGPSLAGGRLWPRARLGNEWNRFRGLCSMGEQARLYPQAGQTIAAMVDDGGSYLRHPRLSDQSDLEIWCPDSDIPSEPIQERARG